MPRTKSFIVENALNEAMRAFWGQGYTATSIEDLLSKMGISRGSMYDTFGDKRSLFISSLKHYDSRLRKEQLRTLEHEHPPLQAIKALFLCWIDTVLNDPEKLGCFLTNTAIELSSRDPEICALVAESQKDIERFFKRMIRNGQRHGEIPRTVDAGRESGALLGSLIGLLVLGRSRPEPTLLKAIAKSAIGRLE